MTDSILNERVFLRLAESSINDFNTFFKQREKMATKKDIPSANHKMSEEMS
ncbi:hypothetical protein [Facklamia sp. 7083-14-GEN3]|uniref:hypothetical protein n=1 Tax=Facklamia sp. 7083-14-GEN3 TaxID=2973478 RepID=UPI00215CCE9A|nr:hypothetical protein [Facklamia sp. 7083-14-GEN3]MCR8968980.1 hypothetical protein [Facklamia sp. 7083-14-GEN3]